MPKRILSGVVVSSNSNKTIVVEVTRRVKHKLYHAHDENNFYKKGDAVTIQETKPISKLKSWIAQEITEEGNKITWYKCNQICL